MWFPYRGRENFFFFVLPFHLVQRTVRSDEDSLTLTVGVKTDAPSKFRSGTGFRMLDEVTDKE